MELEKSAVIQLHSMSLDLSAAMLAREKNGPGLGTYASTDFSTFKAAQAFQLRSSMGDGESRDSGKREGTVPLEYRKVNEKNLNRAPGRGIVSSGRERRRRAARLSGGGSEHVEDSKKEINKGKVAAPDPPCGEGMGTGRQIGYRAEVGFHASKHLESVLIEGAPDPPCGEDMDTRCQAMDTFGREKCALALQADGSTKAGGTLDEIHVSEHLDRDSGMQKARPETGMAATASQPLAKTPATRHSWQEESHRAVDGEVPHAPNDNHPEDVQKPVHSSYRATSRHHSDHPGRVSCQTSDENSGTNGACAEDLVPNVQSCPLTLQSSSRPSAENGSRGPPRGGPPVVVNRPMPPLIARTDSVESANISPARNANTIRPPWWRPTLAGTLFKRGKVLKALLPRYFSLAGTVLTCHRDRDAQPSWLLDISGAQLRVQKKRKRFIIETKDGKMLMLYAKSEEEVKEWTTAIGSAADKGKHGKHMSGNNKEDFLGPKDFSSRGTSPTASTSGDSEVGRIVDKTSSQLIQTASFRPPTSRGFSEHSNTGKSVTRALAPDSQRKGNDLQAYARKDSPRLAEGNQARDSGHNSTDLQSLPEQVRPSGLFQKFAER